MVAKQANELAKSMGLDRAPKCWSCVHCIGRCNSPIFEMNEYCKAHKSMYLAQLGCETYEEDKR